MNIKCPSCGSTGEAPEEMMGKEVICSFCKKTFIPKKEVMWARYVYMICIFTVIVGAIIGLAIIWFGLNKEVAGRAIGTLFSLSICAAIMVSFNEVFANKKLLSTLANQVCYAICMVCLGVGTLMVILVIWSEGETNKFGWKGISSSAVVFFASLFMVGINSVFRDYDFFAGKVREFWQSRGNRQGRREDDDDIDMRKNIRR